MSYVPPAIGQLTQAFAAADVVGLEGRVYADPDTGKAYKLVKNTSATALSAKMICKITNLATYEVQPNGTLHHKNFGGVRPVGADDIAQNQFGWVQVRGYFSNFLEGNACNTIVAGDLLIPDDDVALGRVGGALTAPATNSAANIGLYGDCHDAAFAFAITAGLGVADTAIAANIFRNGWGI